MIIIDQRDRRPIYEQITEKLSDLMVRGVLNQDEPLPSVRALATELSINPNTVQRAYIELERRGFIYSVKGRGSFAADLQSIRNGKKEALFQELNTLAQRAAAAGFTEEEFTDAAAKAIAAARKQKGEAE